MTLPFPVAQVLHLGLPRWHYAYTSVGLDGIASSWVRTYAAGRNLARMKRRESELEDASVTSAFSRSPSLCRSASSLLSALPSTRTNVRTSLGERLVLKHCVESRHLCPKRPRTATRHLHQKQSRPYSVSSRLARSVQGAPIEKCEHANECEQRDLGGDFIARNATAMSDRNFARRAQNVNAAFDTQLLMHA